MLWKTPLELRDLEEYRCQLKQYIILPNGDFRTMSSYMPDLKMSRVKIVNSAS